ncbi:hypothetical protein PTKIN_Ptkin10aG0049500 [Pterospermum kingtungense]
MSTAASLLKLSLPLCSFKSSTAKFPMSQRTANSNNAAANAILIKLSPWRPLAERKNQVPPQEIVFRGPKEVPSGPNYSPPWVPPGVPQIPTTPEVDPSDTPPEFTTSDPPPLGRPKPDTDPDFPKPPLGPPPTGPEVPFPPPGKAPPPDIVPPPSTPPDHVPPPSIPPDISPPGIPPDIPPTKGPTFVF